jgi:hypothetical protein
MCKHVSVRRMKKDLYGNKDIRIILGIPERRVINLADKGVVQPFVNSAGAGSQRRYNYVNLLEFALAEDFFSFGLGIHLVRKILNELRQGGHLRDWAENWYKYYGEVAAKHVKWLKKMHHDHPEEFPHFKSVVLRDGKDLGLLNPSVEKIIERLRPQKPVGLLVCKFKKEGLFELKVIPWDRENFLATLFLGEYAYSNARLLIINLGEIKMDVDRKIEN